MINSIKLITENGDELSLNVFQGQWTFRIEDIINTNTFVYEDRKYKIRVDADEDIDSVWMRINDETKQGSKDGRAFLFEESQYFKNQIGFVQITLETEKDATGEHKSYYTEFASILIRSDKNQAVEAMLKYIYDNQAIALTRKHRTSSVNRDHQLVFEDLESQLLLLEDIVSIYENNYGFFKANSRTVLVPTETIDRIEKLQYIGPKTLAFIAQHPELMKSEASGIKYGKTSYLPSRTLIIRESVSRDIYENQVVQSFLAHALRDGENLIGQIDELLQLIQHKGQGRTEHGYIVSCSVLFMNARDILQAYKQRVKSINNRLANTYVAYEQILNATRIDLAIQPKPTAIFLGVPQYSQIYSCITRWFGKTGYDFSMERNMLNYFNVSTVYEVYILTRIINILCQQGYTLDETRIINYNSANNPFSPRDYSNYYRFSRPGNTITLYYEPVITNDSSNQNHGLNIYRNNSTAFEGGRGTYYTPDFVLVKTDGTGKETYIIADAKYDYLNNVRKKMVPELSYKYLISMSPLTAISSIEGLHVICGLNDNGDEVKSFYDKERTPKIAPFIDLVPLTATMPESDQVENINYLLQRLL